MMYLIGMTHGIAFGVLAYQIGLEIRAWQTRRRMAADHPESHKADA